jgi:drug/metabolite transporter (DMT)-like permease
VIERRIPADMALAFCSLLWGVTFVVVRNALNHVSVFLFLAVRFSLAAVLMAVFRPAGLRNLKKQELFAGAALGLFMFGGLRFRLRACNTLRPQNPGS